MIHFRTAIHSATDRDADGASEPIRRSGSVRSRTRRIGLVFAALGLGLAVTACQPVGGAAVATPKLTEAEQALINKVRLERQLHPFLTCVRRHESDRGPWPHTNGYRAKNPRSSASGAYQFLDSTWRYAAQKVGATQFTRAMDAPPHVQDDAAHWMISNGYKSAWNGTGCK